MLPISCRHRRTQSRVAPKLRSRCLRRSERGYINNNNRLEGFAPGTIAEIIRHLIDQGRKYVLIT